MTITGHKWIGLAVGLAVGSLIKAGNPAFSLWWLVILVPAAIQGASFPDRIEWSPFGFRWIPHRTWTHWWPLWIVPLILLIGAGNSIPVVNWHPVIPAALTAFMVGGISHLLVDLPNPSGIPVLTPFHRMSLNCWESGDREWRLVLAALLAVAPLWWGEILMGIDQARSISNPAFAALRSLAIG